MGRIKYFIDDWLEVAIMLISVPAIIIYALTNNLIIPFKYFILLYSLIYTFNLLSLYITVYLVKIKYVSEANIFNKNRINNPMAMHIALLSVVIIMLIIYPYLPQIMTCIALGIIAGISLDFIHDFRTYVSFWFENHKQYIS